MAYKRSELMEKRLAGNRERILVAARRLVAAGGYRNAPITAVAAEAGVSTGLIYRHFPSKAELFVEVLTFAVEHELEILAAIADQPLPAPQRLQLAVASFVRRAMAGPGLAYAFIAEPVDPEVEAERIRCRRLFGDVFKRILEDGVRAASCRRRTWRSARPASSVPSPKPWLGRPRPAVTACAMANTWSLRSVRCACAQPVRRCRSECCKPCGMLQCRTCVRVQGIAGAGGRWSILAEQLLVHRQLARGDETCGITTLSS